MTNKVKLTSKKRIKVLSKIPQEIIEHYKIEKKLAEKLRNSNKEQRKRLYSALYDELCRQTSIFSQKKDSRKYSIEIFKRLNFIKKLLNTKTTFLEIGPGDCCFSREVSKYVKKVYAVDVSKELTKSKNPFPHNFKLIISDGFNLKIPDNSIDIAYSNQVIEHLHPDDAFKQLKNIYKILKYGGKYICITPNRLNGPHDISAHFDKVATCFHLKEYTFIELFNLFCKVGFVNLRYYINLKWKNLRFPSLFIKKVEKFLNLFPNSLRKEISSTLPFRVLLNIQIIGTK